MRHSATCNVSGLTTLLILFMVAGAAVLVSPVPAAPAGITVSLPEERPYLMGENLYFSGTNFQTNTTYLFITGPNLPAGGGIPTSPFQPVTGGNPLSFGRAPVSADGSWHYSLFTAPLGIAPGIYTLYAVTAPADQKGLAPGAFNTTPIILGEPVVSAEVSPSSVRRGDRFTVQGRVTEYPGQVQVWIIGGNFLYNTTVPVQADNTFSLKIGTKTSESLPPGQAYIIVQHPREADVFNIVVNGDWVYQVPHQGRGEKLFRISGPGSLQGRDAVDAMIAAFGTTGHGDRYTVLPLAVNSTRITAYELVGTQADSVLAQPSPPAATATAPVTTPLPAELPGSPAPAVTGTPAPSGPAATRPVPAGTRTAPLGLALPGAVAVTAGIVLLGRR